MKYQMHISYNAIYIYVIMYTDIVFMFLYSVHDMAHFVLHVLLYIVYKYVCMLL